MEVLGGCSIAWFAFGILIFVVLIMRKQLNDNIGVEYNTILGFILSIIPFLITVSFTGSPKWSLLVGLVGAIVGGVIGGYVFGGEGSDGDGGWF